MMARNMLIGLSQCHVPLYINMKKRKRKEEHHLEQVQEGIFTPNANGFDVRVRKLVTRLERESMAHGSAAECPQKRERTQERQQALEKRMKNRRSFGPFLLFKVSSCFKTPSIPSIARQLQ